MIETIIWARVCTVRTYRGVQVKYLAMTFYINPSIIVLITNIPLSLYQHRWYIILMVLTKSVSLSYQQAHKTIHKVWIVFLCYLNNTAWATKNDVGIEETSNKR